MEEIIMEYRKFGKTGIQVSEIGMGLEHLLDKDEQIVLDTIHAAIDGGVTYFDCFPGHEGGHDEENYVKLGRAINGKRDKLCLSHIAAARTTAEVQTNFEKWLSALNTDYTDVFMIACCDKVKDYNDIIGEGGILEAAKKLKSDGKARFIGISTHSMDIAFKAINSKDFDVLMFPINPAFDVLDDEKKYNEDMLGNLWDKAYVYNPKGESSDLPRKSVYSACKNNGIALVAMKPFAGGFVFGVEQEAGFTPVNLISYALTQTGLSTVVPGCESPEQVRSILTYYTCPDAERDYSGAVAKSRWSIKGKCLYCNHCLPCPADINIGQVNKLLDTLDITTPSDKAAVQDEYMVLPVKSSACMRCGECESRCPFAVPVIERMEQAERAFGQ
jgi:predicted aldo/keto reductase-like oxidoreductase